MSRADDLQAAHDRTYWLPPVVAVDPDLVAMRAAVPDLLAVVQAADEHCEVCCRVDVTLREVLASANRLQEAVSAFEAGAK